MFGLIFKLSTLGKKESPENLAFIEAIGLLSSKGIKDRAIADALGVNRQKISNIKQGSSTADHTLLQSLYEVYPEVNPSHTSPEESSVNEKLDELLKEMKENNQLLREIKADLLKEETRADAIAKLTDMLHKKEMGEE